MVSDDLNKLMGKLKKKEDPEKELEEDEEEIEEDDEEDDEDEEKVPEEKEVKEKSDKKPSQEEVVNGEVGVLQNNGIFRRELLLILKELVDVNKVNAQVLIDLRKKLCGEDEDKEKKK